MMSPGPSADIWIAAGHTDMRRGMHGLSALVQTVLAESDWHGGQGAVGEGPTTWNHWQAVGVLSANGLAARF